MTQQEAVAAANATENATVLEYVYDKPEATMAAEDQIVVLRSICIAFDAACGVFPAATTEELRETVLNCPRIPQARLFQRLYPKVFASITVRVRSDAQEEALDRVRKGLLSSLQSVVQRGGDRDGMAAVDAQRVCFQLSLRDTTTADRESGTVLSAEQAAAARTQGALQPLHPTAMGPSLVRQSRPSA